MTEIVDVVVVLLTRFLRRILLRKVRSLRLPTVLWQVLQHLVTIREDVETRCTKTPSFAGLHIDDWDLRLPKRVMMT